MALSDEKIPYEILIRFSPEGNLQGAHVRYRRRVVLDGEVLKDEPLVAEPLDLASTFPVSDLLNDVTARALTQVNYLSSRCDELETSLAAKAEESRLATDEINQLNERIVSIQNEQALGAQSI